MAIQNSTEDIFTSSTEAYVTANLTDKFTASVVQVVGSWLELRLITTYGVFVSVAVFVGNGVIFGAVFRKPELHVPRYYLLFLYALIDIVSIITSIPLAIIVLFQGYDMSELFCRITSGIGISAVYTSVNVLGLLAYERYHFFCRPLTYDTFFTTGKVTCMVAAAWIIPLGYCVATEILIGRQVSIAEVGCRMERSKILSLLQINCLIGPGVLLLLWSLVRVSMTWVKMKAKIVPPAFKLPNNSADNNLPAGGLFRAKAANAGAAVKMIVLVSGTSLATYIPGFICRSIVYSGGATWEEIQSGQDRTAMLVLRYNGILMGTLSQLLNPYVYLITHPELRAAVKQLLKRK